MYFILLGDEAAFDGIVHQQDVWHKAAKLTKVHVVLGVHVVHVVAQESASWHWQLNIVTSSDVVKSIYFCCDQESKKAALRPLQQWSSSIRNHFWHCCQQADGDVEKLTVSCGHCKRCV